MLFDYLNYSLRILIFVLDFKVKKTFYFFKNEILFLFCYLKISSIFIFLFSSFLLNWFLLHCLLFQLDFTVFILHLLLLLFLFVRICLRFKIHFYLVWRILYLILIIKEQENYLMKNKLGYSFYDFLLYLFNSKVLKVELLIDI